MALLGLESASGFLLEPQKLTPVTLIAGRLQVCHTSFYKVLV